MEIAYTIPNDQNISRLLSITRVCNEIAASHPLIKVVGGYNTEERKKNGAVSLILPLPMGIATTEIKTRITWCFEEADSVIFANSDAGLCISFCVANIRKAEG